MLLFFARKVEARNKQGQRCIQQLEKTREWQAAGKVHSIRASVTVKKPESMEMKWLTEEQPTRVWAGKGWEDLVSGRGRARQYGFLTNNVNTVPGQEREQYWARSKRTFFFFNLKFYLRERECVHASGGGAEGEGKSLKQAPR